MSLASINARIHEQEPKVTLYKGEGYLYYEYDDVDGDTGVFETESVMTPYLCDQTDGQWVADGLKFGEKVRANADGRLMVVA